MTTPHSTPVRDAIRPLTDADTGAAGRLGREAFGFPTDPSAPHRSPVQPGRTSFGFFDGDRLAAKVVDLELDSWFGGVLLPTSGIAGVTVAAEDRGRGLLRPLFDATLAGARDRGALVSGLFPSQPGIYRRLGYELVTSLDTVTVPADALAEVGRPDGVSTRRATVADRAAVLAVYTDWATRQNGPLSRRGPVFDSDSDEDWLAETHGISLAERDGAVIGYCSWNRGAADGSGPALAVPELFATETDGYRALLRLVAGFGSVAGQVSLDTSGDDVVRLLLRRIDWQVTGTHPYMLAVLDVAGALGALHYPTALTAGLSFAVTGLPSAAADGGYRLTVADGRADCERDPGARPTGADVPVFAAQGLALLLAGSQNCANLRLAGLLTGPDADDGSWDAALGGRRSHIRDSF